MTRRARIRTLTPTLLVLTATLLTACGSGGPKQGSAFVDKADFPAAMVALPGGGLLFAERATGRVRRADADGRVAVAPVAEVEVSASGQRGLLGLAVDRAGRVFAAWTALDGHLLVGQVAPGLPRTVWRGPASADVANGGRLAFDPTGRLVVGIGDLTQPRLVADPESPNGKLLRLDPDAPADQRPEVVSSGWNNPFAFAFTPGGDLWVADNAPGEKPERLTRGDRAGAVTRLPAKTAPSGLAAPADDELLVCSYLSRHLLRYRIEDGRATPDGTLVDDCRLGVTVLADGRVVYATESSIRVVGS